MASDASDDWAGVQAAHIGELDADAFEAFCADLVASEAYGRHPEPDIDLPAGRYLNDGGRDLLLSVAQAPIISKTSFQQKYCVGALSEDPLAPPRPTRVAYSCKTGSSWFELAMKDANKRAARAVEVLAEGGYFKLLTNQSVLLDETKVVGGEAQTRQERLRDAFWERLKERDPSAADPGPRIRILDAKKLAEYLRARRPESPQMDQWAERMQVTPLLWSLEQWRASHESDRGEPSWVEDDERARIRGELSARLLVPQLRADERSACVVGKPGVGKTRRGSEVLRASPAVAARVRVARSAEEAERAIETHRLLERHPEVVLIVDDCLVEEARAISHHFRAAAGRRSGARLVLLVPAAFEVVRADLPRDEIWSLDPLAHENTRGLVAEIVGRPGNDPEVAALGRLSEGFPWFARLLADEFLAAGHAPADMREALRWALASRQEASSPAQLRPLQLRRARSLLAAALTGRVDWDELDDDQRERLAKAVGLSHWQELLDAALECHQRGLLRRRLGWEFKYVTPQVLERELIAWLLDPDEGPDPGGRTLARYAEPYLESFFATLERLDLPASILTGVTNVALADLCAVELSGLDAAGLGGSRLRLLASRRPAETARELWRMIEASDLDELRARRRERRSLVRALETTATGPSSFEDSEAGLFRLARAENEGDANNATQTWAHLLVPELPSTHRSADQRLRLLARRLTSDEPQARLTALHGVEVALSSFASWVRPRVHEPGWVRPSAAEARAGRLRAWSLLAERFDDPEASVAARARRLAIEQLRDAVARGLGAEAMALLVPHVEGWSLDERVLLGDILRQVRHYDADHLASLGEQLARLEAAAALHSFHERLRQRVGMWRPELSREQEERLDDELAREGLRGDLPLRDELAWLGSEEAERGHMFAYALGRCDDKAILFEELRRVAGEKPESWQAQALLARYLGGMAMAGRRARAETLLQAMEARPDEATPAALAIVELGATPEHLRWLERAFSAGRIHASAVEELGRRNEWLAEADEEAVFRLLRVMSEDGAEGGAVERVAALDILVSRYRDVEMPARACDLLERLLSELEQVQASHRWWRAAKMLVDHDRSARAAQLAVATLSRAGGSNEFAWRLLHAAAARDPVAAFAAVAAALDESGPYSALLTGFQFHREPFEWPGAELLEWVGHDERKARAAAALVQARSDRLPEIIRELIRRFGPHGSVARELRARLSSTGGLVASLAEHDLQSLERARAWAEDPDPSVAAFAETLVDELERSYEWRAAKEEDLRERYGT